MQEQEYLIEIATQEHDLARVIEVINAAYKKVKYLQEGIKRIALAEMIENLSDPNKRLYLCIAPNKEICGTILVHFNAQDTAKLGLFAVHPDYQGQNIGSVLLRAVEKAAFAEAKRIFLYVIPCTQERLIRFYEHLGYRKTGETREFPAEAKAHYIRPEYRDQIFLLIMEKRICDADASFQR